MDYEQAGAIVRKIVEPELTGPATLHVPEWGWEDATAFHVPYGSRERREDDRDEFTPLDPLLAFVDKASGRVKFAPYLECSDRLNAMTKVGTGHPPDDD